MGLGETSKWITLYYPRNDMSSGEGGDRQTIRWMGLLPRYSFTAKLPDPFTDLSNVIDNGEEVADTMNVTRCVRTWLVDT